MNKVCFEVSVDVINKSHITDWTRMSFLFLAGEWKSNYEKLKEII